MKELQNFKLTDRLGLGVKPALAYLEKTLQSLQFVDFGEMPIASLLDQNLEMDDYGNCTITVKTLEQEVEIKGAGPQSVYLRNHNGVLEYSNDHAAWSAVGSGGSGGGGGDMSKSTYDPNDDGRVAAAETLADGVHTVTAALAKQHLDDSAIHFEQTAIDHQSIQNRGNNTHAQLDAHLADTSMHGGGTLPAVWEIPISADPTPVTGKAVLYGKEVDRGADIARSVPKRGARPLPQLKYTIPTIMLEDGSIRPLCLLQEDGKMAWEHLPLEAMLTTAYVQGAVSTPVGRAENLVTTNGMTLPADDIQAHLLAAIAILGVVQTAPAATSSQVKLYTIMADDGQGGYIQELHVKFANGTDKILATDVA